MSTQFEEATKDLRVGGGIDRRREAKSRRGVDGEKIGWSFAGGGSKIVHRPAYIDFHGRQRLGRDLISVVLSSTGGVVVKDALWTGTDP